MNDTILMTYLVPQNRDRDAMRAVRSAPGVEQASILVAPEHFPRFVLEVHAYPSDAIPDGVALDAVATQAMDEAGIQHELISNGRGTLSS